MLDDKSRVELEDLIQLKSQNYLGHKTKAGGGEIYCPLETLRWSMEFPIYRMPLLISSSTHKYYNYQFMLFSYSEYWRDDYLDLLVIMSFVGDRDLG